MSYKDQQQLDYEQLITLLGYFWVFKGVLPMTIQRSTLVLKPQHIYKAQMNYMLERYCYCLSIYKAQMNYMLERYCYCLKKCYSNSGGQLCVKAFVFRTFYNFHYNNSYSSYYKPSYDYFLILLILCRAQMQAQEDETTILLKKIAAQDEIIQKLQAEDAKLTNYIKEFRETMQRKLSKESDSAGKNATDEQKMEKQLEKELESAKLMLKNYQNELKALHKKNNKNKFTADNLIQMEIEIKKKQAYLRQLNDDIKNLNIVKRKQEKIIEKKEKNEDGNKLSKMVEQIRKQRQILDALKAKHQQKEEALQKRKQNVVQIQKQYIEKCKKYGEKPLTFEQFKQKRVRKGRQDSMAKIYGDSKKEVKKPIQTVKDIINSHLEIENIQISEKGLNDLIEKKAVMQNSLKIASKKFDRQIEQLTERVEELRKENQNLNLKYLQKKKQKELIQTAKTVNFKRNSSKTIKRLDPLK